MQKKCVDCLSTVISEYIRGTRISTKKSPKQIIFGTYGYNVRVNRASYEDEQELYDNNHIGGGYF